MVPLAVCCLTMFIIVLDTSMMNVAVPTIVRDLDTDVSSVQAAISLYSVVMAALMITGGKLGDLLGVRRVFTGALVASGRLRSA
jgi:MFS family permease